MSEIYIAETCGLCFGSNNAISKTKEQLEKRNNVVLFKEILHNKNVMKTLQDKGAVVKDTIEEINKNDFVIIRAHGEPLSTFKHFEDNEIGFLDCTCPKVKAINLIAQEKDKQGYKIIIIGKHGFDGKPMHPEVAGTAGWCNNPLFVEDESEIEKIDLSFEKYFLVVQTTFSKDKAELFIEKISNFLKANNKIFDFKNTVCNAQKEINLSAQALATKVDAMVVIGGKNSSNTKELFLKLAQTKPTFWIENVQEAKTLVDEKKLTNDMKIGITAGASTLKEDVVELKNELEKILK